MRTAHLAFARRIRNYERGVAHVFLLAQKKISGEHKPKQNKTNQKIKKSKNQKIKKSKPVPVSPWPKRSHQMGCPL
jgi:hypothetical protein